MRDLYSTIDANVLAVCPNNKVPEQLVACFWSNHRMSTLMCAAYPDTTLQMPAVQTYGLTQSHLVLANTRKSRQQHVSTS